MRTVLQGTRVRLERLHAERHGQELFHASHGPGVDPELWRYLPYGPFAEVEEMRSWLAECSSSKDPLFFAVVDVATGQAGGMVSFLRIALEHRCIEIGHIWFGRPLQRTPQATEAIYLLARHAFDDLGNRRLEWKCNASNARSRRAAGRFGFTFEGVFRQHMIVRGANRDTAWYALLDREWPRRRAAFEAWLDPANFDAEGLQRRPLSATGILESRDPGTPTWFIDELDYAGRENLDADHVARYDVKEDASAASEVALLSDFGLTSDSLVVEFGAGTGQFSVAVAPVCAQVIAVDVSPLMLGELAGKAEALCLTNIEMVRAGFLTYEHTGSPADLIYSRYALHHLPDFWKAVAFDRLRRMICPGGIVRLWDVVYDFAPSHAEDRIEAWCATGGETVEAEWTRAELEEHVRDEYSTFTWLLEPMMRRSGFEIARAEHSDDGVFSKYLLRAV